MICNETPSHARWWTALLVVLAPAYAFAAPPDMPKSHAVPSSNPTTRSALNTANPEAPSIRVSYRDLDITTPAGIATLYVRIRRAASALCDAEKAPIGSRLVTERSERCVRTTIASTVKQLGVPGLAMLDAEQRALGEPSGFDRPSCAAAGQTKIII